MTHLFSTPASAEKLYQKNARMRKAQLNMIVRVLALAIFAGRAVFLLSAARSLDQDEYLNLYTHQLLLTTLREDSSYLDPACKTTADLAACAFLTPAHRCGGSGPACEALAAEKVNASFAAYEPLRPFRWLLTVESEGFVAVDEGEPVRWELGDPALRTLRGQKFAASTRIQKNTASGPAILKVTLLTAVK